MTHWVQMQQRRGDRNLHICAAKAAKGTYYFSEMTHFKL